MANELDTPAPVKEGTPMPCPFCGGEASIGTVRYSERMVREQEWDQDTFFFVSCILCGASNVGLAGHATPGRAAERWNRRSPAVSGEVEELALAVSKCPSCRCVSVDRQGHGMCEHHAAQTATYFAAILAGKEQ